VHLIRNTFRLASKRDWDALKRDVRPIYTAVNAAAARVALGELAETWGARYGAIIRLWENAWAGSSGALPRRSPLRTGRASCPRIRLKQAHRCRGLVQSDRVGAHRAVRLCGRNGCGRGVRHRDHLAVRGAGQR